MSSSSEGHTQAATSEEWEKWEKSKLCWGDSNGDLSTDVLRIIPLNDAAKRAFGDLSAWENLDSHHRKYIHVTREETLFEKHPYDARPSDESSCEESGSENKAKKINIGYYRVSFDLPGLLANHWTVGRGSELKTGKKDRHVDILLTRPKAKEARGLQATHAIIKMNTTSGAWLIKAGDQPASSKAKDLSLQLASVKINDEDICYSEFRCLAKHKTRLDINGLEYCVQFVIDSVEKEVKYCVNRNDKLKEEGLVPPDTAISGIPFESDITVKSLAVCRDGLGCGSFGSVFEGFDVLTGDIRAIKEIEIKRAGYALSVSEEVGINMRLRNREGLVHTYDWRNSKGGKTEVSDTYPMKIYLVLEKGKAFNKHPWSQSPVDWLARRIFLKNLLQGLAHLHNLGWMHRDINPQNMLLVKRKTQEEAVLCDFGKVCFQKTHTETNIAAWDYLPPEIQPGKQEKYGQWIDVYMLAGAMIRCWFPQVMDMDNLKHREQQGHIKIIERLREIEKAAPENSGLLNVLCWMFDWAPGARPTANQALLWRGMKEVRGAKVEKTSDKKRGMSS